MAHWLSQASHVARSIEKQQSIDFDQSSFVGTQYTLKQRWYCHIVHCESIGMGPHISKSGTHKFPPAP